MIVLHRAGWRGAARFFITYMSKIAEEIWSFDNLYAAYLEVARGKREKKEFQRFNLNLEENLICMQNDLIWRTYKSSPTVSFIVREPKKRVITRPQIYDRVIHHALIRVVQPIFEKRFHDLSFACRPGKEMITARAVFPDGKYFIQTYYASKQEQYHWPKDLKIAEAKRFVADDMKKRFPDACSVSTAHAEGKGQLAACKHYQGMLRSALGRYPDGFVVLSLDIKSFFASIDHDVLKRLIIRLFPDDGFVQWLFGCIIDAVDEGLPIGFLPSQHEANLMGTVIDYFVTDVLHCHYYVRYMDDVRILCASREEAKEYLAAIDELCWIKLHLRLSEKKSTICTFHQYDLFCGYKVHPHYLEPKEATLKRGHRRLEKKLIMLQEGLITPDHLRSSALSLATYLSNTSAPTDPVVVKCLQALQKVENLKGNNQARNIEYRYDG